MAELGAAKIVDLRTAFEREFVAAKLAHAGIGEITRYLWPLMTATFTVVLLITYIPWLSLWFPRFLQSL